MRHSLPASTWLNALSAADAPARQSLAALYGTSRSAAEGAQCRLRGLLQSYLSLFGDAPVVLSRAPGRVNVMGRHVDHQGGHVNPIAICRDVWLVCGPRDDRRVFLHNADANDYPAREFELGELLEGWRGEAWLAFLDGEAHQQHVARHRGDWAQYVKAPLARLQALQPDVPLGGMNAVVDGTIPPAAGLSSSSALVVATAEAACELNGIELAPERFVEICGEAEWFVGTRGGAGDHAAMKLARSGHVTQIGFYPFGAVGTVPFPPGHVLIVCGSRQEARKTVGVRDTFNHRVACYHLGRELIKAAHPELAPAIEHLRDVNTRTLAVPEAATVRLIAELPERATRGDVRLRLPRQTCDRIFASHSEEAGPYPVRAVVVFGLSECERSRRCAELLQQGDVQAFGRWMQVSHDGDRVSRWCGDGARPFEAPYGDDAMLRLGAEASENGLDLALQPGAYACSTERIDRMVDTALAVEGVLGAQMAGAGLGGCMMVLARQDAAEAVEMAMKTAYYEPLGLEPQAMQVAPVAGSGVLAL